MNIPKFRAWHIESKVMLDVIGLTFHPVLEIYCGENEHGEELLFTADEVTLMRSTGLTDKNGVEIFEGDIVEWILPYDCGAAGGSSIFAPIEWYPEQAVFWMANRIPDGSARCYSGAVLNDWMRGKYIKHGNIYENPDLLKGMSK